MTSKQIQDIRTNAEEILDIGVDHTYMEEADFEKVLMDQVFLSTLADALRARLQEQAEEIEQLREALSVYVDARDCACVEGDELKCWSCHSLDLLASRPESEKEMSNE